MQVFLSYSAADRRFAERLSDELTRQGISVWRSSAQAAPDIEWQKEIEKAIRSSEDILILVSPRSADAAQQFTWREALQAAWQDPRKRLIPVLLRGASVPPFVYGDAAGNEAPLVQILDPRDLRSAAGAIVQALQQGPAAPSEAKSVELATKRSHSYPIEESERNIESYPAEVATKGSQSYAVEGMRSQRVREIEQFAERLRK